MYSVRRRKLRRKTWERRSRGPNTRWQGALGRWRKCSQDDSLAPDWGATKPYCSSVTPEKTVTAKSSTSIAPSSYTKDRAPRRTWTRFSWEHACHSQKLSVSLRAGSGPWCAQERGIQSSPLPLPALLLHVQCLDHTAILPGAWLWSPVFQDSLVTLLLSSPKGSSSPLRETEVRPWPWDGSTQQGPCCPLLTRLVCIHPPCSQRGDLLFVDRSHDGDRAINKSY